MRHRVQSVVLTCLFNRLPLSELRDLGRKMRSTWFRAWRKKTGRSLHLERLSDKERDLTADLEEKSYVEHQKGSLKETELYPDSPCGSTILVIVFMSGALRSSLWRKLSWKVVPVRCARALALMYVCAQYNSHFSHLQTFWTSVPSSKLCQVSNLAAE